MRECKDTLSQVYFDRIIKEVYGDIYIYISDTNSESSSSGLSVEVLMEIADSFDQEVMNYDHNSIDEEEIAKLKSLNNISYTKNKDDVVLEQCIPGERVCIVRPRRVKDEYFHFYARVLEDFKIHVPFTDFKSDLLRTINTYPYELRPNSWGLLRLLK